MSARYIDKDHVTSLGDAGVTQYSFHGDTGDTRQELQHPIEATCWMGDGSRLCDLTDFLSRVGGHRISLRHSHQTDVSGLACKEYDTESNRLAKKRET
jgi:hypothetical protein